MRLIIASLWLAGTGALVFGGASQSNVSPWLFLGLYLGYLVIVATLLGLLCGRLFAQHEFKSARFDIGSQILVTTLIAVPLGVVSCFDVNLTSFAKFGLLIYLYLLIFPTLIFLEAITHFWMRVRNKKE